ncbi:MAG: DUF3488 and transglutaminase-like domain-containing protein, partial [Chloroflexi bacterium]|nr:DUF3488 and transglutaminase-like domain-containing protein [Chloroflexota bacterium]
MTTATQLVGPGQRTGWARHLAAPRQGWSSLVLLLVMLGATGLAIDEQRWMGVSPAGVSQTAMLPLLMVAAGLCGSLLAWSRLSLGWVDLVAALIGTAAGLLLAASAISDATSIPAQLRELSASLERFLQDVLVQDERTRETSAFLLTISALAWTSGVFAAISIFRRSNAIGAIVPIGAILMLEMIAAQRAQDIWLVVFAGASLLLVLRLDLEEQRDHWIQRRIGGGQVVGGMYLRGGAIVVALMLAGSMLLAATASSTTIAGAFPQLDALVQDIAANVQGLVGAPAASQGSKGEFPDERPVGNAWTTDRQVVFVAEPLLGGAHYWRAAAYDSFDGRVWRRTQTTTQDIPLGEDLLAASDDSVPAGVPGYTTVIATITSQSLAGRQLPAPQNPVLLDRDARVLLFGENGTFQVLEASTRLPLGDQYVVSGMEPDLDGPDGLTANQLSATGVDDAEWLDPFRRASRETAGTPTIDEAAEVRDTLPRDARDSYRLASAIQGLLRDEPRFRYSTDIRGVCRSGETVSDCLLRSGVGFCQQYATTMVMMLRSLGVPARYVEGYLPGRPLSDGQYEVDASAAHAWAEVWFTNVGWVRFDPTPGDVTLDENGQQPTDLPPGDPIATAEPPTDEPIGEETFDPLPSDGPVPSESPEPSPPPDTVLPETPGDGGAAGIVILLGVMGGAFVGLGAIGMLWFRRLPGGEPEFAWRGVIGLATRLGFGPRPSQTPYEYTVELSKVVPRAAADLRTVADAKVDATYAAPTGAAAARGPLRDAYRRARLGLL